MSQVIRKYPLGNFADLTTPTATQNPAYKLGDEVAMWDGDYKARKVFKYVYSGIGLTQYGAYQITNSGVAGTEVQSVAFTSGFATIPGPLVGITPVTVTSGYYCFLQTEGHCTGLIAATSTNVAGCACLTAAASASLVGSTATTPLTSTVAYYVSGTSGASGVMYLPGGVPRIITT